MTSSYKRPWACSYRLPLVRLANGEVGCLDCLHVVVRRDGTAVPYLIPSQAKALEALAVLVSEAAA